MRYSTQQITISAVLIVLALLLGFTPLGNINIPTVGQAITIMHIPAILGGILQGPFMGALVGGIFGITTTYTYEPHDPIVQIPPRIFIGIFSYLTYMLMRSVLRKNRSAAQNTIGATTAAIVGTLINTVGTLWLAVIRGYYSPDQVIPTALIHGPLEILVAVIVVVPLTIALKATTQRSPFWE